MNLKLDLNITRNIFKKDSRLHFICEICFSVAVCYTCKLVKCSFIFSSLLFLAHLSHRLKVSYCDNRMSVVHQSVILQVVVNHLMSVSPLSIIRCPSVRCRRAGVNNFFYITSPPKPLRGNSPNFAGMVLGLFSFKVVQGFSFHAEIWLSWQPKGITLKIFLLAGQISKKKIGTNGRSFGDPLLELFKLF